MRGIFPHIKTQRPWPQSKALSLSLSLSLKSLTLSLSHMSYHAISSVIELEEKRREHQRQRQSAPFFFFFNPFKNFIHPTTFVSTLHRPAHSLTTQTQLNTTQNPITNPTFSLSLSLSLFSLYRSQRFLHQISRSNPFKMRAFWAFISLYNHTNPNTHFLFLISFRLFLTFSSISLQRVFWVGVYLFPYFLSLSKNRFLLVSLFLAL